MNLLQEFRNREDYNQIIFWYEKFQKADKIKKLAYNNYFLWDKLNIDMDKRMNNVWESVKKIEPVQTFDNNGYLTRQASGLLNMAKISKAFKK
jgi:hypothetical protein